MAIRSILFVQVRKSLRPRILGRFITGVKLRLHWPTTGRQRFVGLYRHAPTKWARSFCKDFRLSFPDV